MNGLDGDLALAPAYAAGTLHHQVRFHSGEKGERVGAQISVVEDIDLVDHVN